LDPIEITALALASLAAGSINAIAGGGTLIAFPVLLAVGYSSTVANVTNTLAVFPGTVGGSLGYRGEISRQRQTIIYIAVPVVAGAIGGAALFIATPTDTFDVVVPFLILGACALLAMQDRLQALIAGSGHVLAGSSWGLWLLRAGVFAVAIYGGYFGAAMGIIMLAMFGLLLTDDIQHANGLKNLIAMVVNGLAAAYFALFGDVAWEAAAIMALGSLVGGYAGVGLARRLNRGRLRQFAVAYGTIAALVLMARNL
jgi:uncharacterized membrane protein YfcA